MILNMNFARNLNQVQHLEYYQKDNTKCKRFIQDLGLMIRLNKNQNQSNIASQKAKDPHFKETKYQEQALIQFILNLAY